MIKCTGVWASVRPDVCCGRRLDVTGILGSEDLHTSGDDVNLLLAVINPVIMDNVENK